MGSRLRKATRICGAASHLLALSVAQLNLWMGPQALCGAVDGHKCRAAPFCNAWRSKCDRTALATVEEPENIVLRSELCCPLRSSGSRPSVALWKLVLAGRPRHWATSHSLEVDASSTLCLRFACAFEPFSKNRLLAFPSTISLAVSTVTSSASFNDVSATLSTTLACCWSSQIETNSVAPRSCRTQREGPQPW